MSEARLFNSWDHLLGERRKNLTVCFPKSCSTLSYQTKFIFQINCLKLSYSSICCRHFCCDVISRVPKGCGSQGAGPQGDLMDWFIVSVYKFSSNTYRCLLLTCFIYDTEITRGCYPKAIAL